MRKRLQRSRAVYISSFAEEYTFLIRQSACGIKIEFQKGNNNVQISNNLRIQPNTLADIMPDLSMQQMMACQGIDKNYK